MLWKVFPLLHRKSHFVLLLWRSDSQNVGLWARGGCLESFMGIKYIKEYLIMLEGVSFLNYENFHKQKNWKQQIFKQKYNVEVRWFFSGKEGQFLQQDLDTRFGLKMRRDMFIEVRFLMTMYFEHMLGCLNILT